MTYPTMALTIGMTGQDRPCLAELSLGNGYELYCSVRRPRQFSTGRSWSRTTSCITGGAGTGGGLRPFIDPQAEKYNWSGLDAPRLREAVLRHLAHGSLACEVGAQIGFVSSIAARADWYESKHEAVL